MTKTKSPGASRYSSTCDTLFINANLATMAGPGTIENACLAVKGNTVEWTGPMTSLAAPPESLAGKVIDCCGKWILPGFVDCHTHMIWAGSRAKEFQMRLAGKTYEEISRQGGGIFSTVRAVREASEDRLFNLAKDRLTRFLHQGSPVLRSSPAMAWTRKTNSRCLPWQAVLAATSRFMLSPPSWAPMPCPRNFQNGPTTMWIW